MVFPSLSSGCILWPILQQPVQSIDRAYTRVPKNLPELAGRIGGPHH
jgi:hypothetical protein